MKLIENMMLVYLFGYLCVMSAVIHAENNAALMQEMLVTGTIIDEDAVYRHIPKFSISAEDIAVLHPPAAVDLLRHVPGLDVTQQGGAGGLTLVSVRGGDPNFTVVLIDGIKVDDPTNSRGGGFDFAGLDPLLIEKIDVFYGGYSAVYGSDALGGIISITTKGGASSTLTGTAEVGTHEAWAGAVHVSGPLNRAVSASVSGVVRDGGDAVDGDSMERQQLSIKLTNTTDRNRTADWGLNFFISDAEATGFPIASGGDQLAVLRDVETRHFDQISTGGRISWSLRTNWQTKLAGGWARYKEVNNSPGIAPGVLSGVPPVVTDSRYERGNVTLTNTVFVTDSARLGFGAEAIWEKGDIASLIDFGFPLSADFSQTRDTWAIFGEAAVNVGDHVTLIGGLRHDDADEITSTNGRVGANITLGQTNTSATLLYAEGFKLPSLFALGHPLTGNPDLDAERSESISLSLQQPFANDQGTVSLSLYHNKFKDLVDFDPTRFLHVNRSSATTKGIDLAVRSELGKGLQMNGHVGYLHTRVSDGTRLELRPKWKGGLTLSWRPGKRWLVTLAGNFNGDFYDVAVPMGEVKLEGYTDMDVGIHFAATDKLELKLLVDNVFDNDYEEALGFSTASRQARLAISVRLDD